jgi:Arrestin (or S-antigen), C-terminal domain
MVPVYDEISTTFCCWSSKSRTLQLKASIPFSGYTPGQSVRLTIRINNRCGFDVYRTVISLKKVFTFISQMPDKRSWVDTKTLLKNIVEGAKNGCERKILGVVEVPQFTLPTNDAISSIVKVSYIVQVAVDVVGFIRSPKVKLPIVIGSKPLKFD